MTDQRAEHATGAARPGPRRRRLVGALALVLAGGLVAAGCASETTTGSSGDETTTTAPPEASGVVLRNMGDEGDPVDGGKFVFGLEAETESGLNPITGQFAASGHYLASAVFDPLATLDENGQTVPYLAESITPNEDFTTWTIVVRDGVTFHDGTELNAEAVQRTLEGHRTSIISKDAVRNIAGTEVIDDRTLEVTMVEPWAQFPYVLTTQVGYVPAPSMLDDPDGAFNPVGTGPFEFESWDVGTSFTATKNPHYWQDGKPHLASIEFRPIPDAQLRSEGVLTGELDLMHTITPRDITMLRGEDVKMLEFSNGEEQCVTLNSAVAPFDDITARQAVVAATDVDRLLAETGRDISQPATGVFAPGQMGYREDSGAQGYDLEKAKALVQEYEAKTGQPLSFVYSGADTVDDQTSGQILKSMWEEAGMQVELVAVPQSDQIIQTVLGDYQATDWRNFGSPDPDGDYVWWHSTSVAPLQSISLNVPRIGDAELDAALDEARATTDAARRDELYATVNERLNATFGYVWLERPVWALAADPRVNGFAEAQNGSISTIGAKTWLADLWVDS